MIRTNDRKENQLRPVTIIPNYTEMAAGSVLICCGRTKVICTASVEESVPPFLKGKGKGWLTAEYAMLPGSTDQRKQREYSKRDGRSVEIQRLIGRSLRACCDLTRLGERTIYLDCDVIQADGGTRTASITGSFVALCLAVNKLIAAGKMQDSPVTCQLAAVSCGIVDETPLLDLEYIEDSRAQVDMNLVMTRNLKTGETDYVEIQGTGEGRTLKKNELNILLGLGEEGICTLMDCQKEALGDAFDVIGRKQKLVMASGNFGKLKEMRLLLGDKFDVVSMKELGLDPDIDENGETFEENAMIKANALMQLTGCACIADDSGLEVDALGGRPGVHSARYCGVHGDDEANNQLLLKELDNTPDAERTARYVCAMALVRPGHEPIVVRGTCEGSILREYRGNGGFGYDPLFFSTDLGVTFAEASLDAKNGVSHRARAINKVLEALD